MTRKHFFLDFDFLALGFDSETQAAEDAHVDIGDPDERE
jgi:hypothetical protein